jgi:DNA-binding beta-propeller fold protein YncE
MLRRLFFVLTFVGAAGTLALPAASPIPLPTGRRIVPPSGPFARVGTMPEGLALTRDGTRLLVVESGFDPPALRILDARTLAVRGTVALRGAYGVPLVDPQGDGAWLAGANTNAIIHVDLRAQSVDRTLRVGARCWPSAIARIDREHLAVACESRGDLAFVDETTGGVRRAADVGRAPSAIAVAPEQHLLFVTAWGDHSVAVVDGATRRLVRRIRVGMHPEALAPAPDGRHLFVADTDDDSISVIDMRELDRGVRTVRVPFDGTGLFGDSLNSLAVARENDRLYVTAGAANAVYALGIGPGGSLRLLGAIPVGWYPTAAVVAGNRLYVADAYGEGSHANPDYDPIAHLARNEYVARADTGIVQILSVPTDAQLAAGARQVRLLAGSAWLRPDPVVRAGGPIKHVIYVIKENRSYDQVFGDIKRADGDPDLVLFGERITPNEHAIVRRFGVFDRTFTDAKVSADGHNWSTAAIANDYVEKMWPQQYARRRRIYDFEDPAAPSRPHAGYLWDDAMRSHVSLRNYGEFIYKNAPEDPSFPITSRPTRSLTENTDYRFAGFTFAVSDLTREAEWRREFGAFERSGKLPQLEIVRFPNDHTQGTKPGALTPQAYVAQNDEAVGRLVDAVSHSKFWGSTAIFIIEDDSQSGPDHVDSQRTTFMLASPYARGGVQHARYTTAGVLHTIEIILGMEPMTTYDARAVPMYAAFTAKPDLRPYAAIAAQTDLNARNGAGAYRARRAARLDFDRADAVPDATMNDMLWHAVRGADAKLPPFGNFPE